MRKHKKLLLFIGMAALALALLIAAHNNEPRYQGHPLSYWVGPRSETNLVADPYLADTTAIKQIGTNALPYLVKWASYTTPRWQSTLAELAVKAGLSQAQYVQLPPVQRQIRADAALSGLISLGNDAAPALRDFACIVATDRITDKTLRARRCLYVLLFQAQHNLVFSTRPPSTNAPLSTMLTGALTDTNPAIREVATNALRAALMGYGYTDPGAKPE